ncbi:uncharacterized protein LOC127006577 isoform X45 [Eriocheir sinensis]|uniref:uncharacterized protein LOC127006577 isoform X43 n=1 Tax=Eriocheir sinensis TaxID=95602 RepID=UPI0021C8440D|nr:uncharacterized protein LOC127006577 isoform X43 [Eriocheir sinensis]XP_050732586.1 uncharacterized protein LOC127006577 isoform X44 [Eriocheir sinensis]XP_050732587.1 uncharacterized protein LOC127006577 isoform X45 [Eriocheir sinensis]
MADRFDDPEDWELRPFSSGKLKKSSSVEILLGTHNSTRGRLLASSPNHPSRGTVTSHKMKGSGRPSSNGKSDTLPAQSASSGTRQVPNGGVTKPGSKDKEAKSAHHKAPKDSEGKRVHAKTPKDSEAKKEHHKREKDIEKGEHSKPSKDTANDAEFKKVKDTEKDGHPKPPKDTEKGAESKKVKDTEKDGHSKPSKNTEKDAQSKKVKDTEKDGHSKSPKDTEKGAHSNASKDTERGAESKLSKDIEKGAESNTSKDSDSRSAQPYPVQRTEKPIVPLSAVNPDLMGSNTSLRRMSSTPLHPGYNTPRRRESETPMPFMPLSAIPLSLLGSNSSLRRVSETPSVPHYLTSTPVQTTKPQTSHATQNTPPMSRLRNLKELASRLPLLVTKKPEYPSPNSTPQDTPKSTPKSTPKVTPKGTPIIGKRGHVFSVSTPEVEPETGHPSPLIPSEAVRMRRHVKECEGDPLDQRRRIKPPTGENIKDDSDKDKAEGGGDGDEPVWQRRLSLLFIPPTENELEEPEKEPEETTRLLPKNIQPHILRKQSIDSLCYTPPRSRKKEREERAARKRERDEEKKREREREEKERERKEREEKEAKEREEKERELARKEKEKTSSSKRNKKVEEEEEDLQPARIIYEDERRGKEKKESNAKFSRLRRSSISDAPSSSSSSHATSEEEEEEDEEENEQEPGGDDYTSWDDTICSNRSAYFKKYYTQRGVIGKSPDEIDGSFKSPFEASHNSLSSLIREKMGKLSPGQGKKGVQVGLVVLVVVLLVIIVTGISLTTYFYKLHLLELSIFNRIKFFESPRHLMVYDPTWEPVITAHLGTNLPDLSIPEDCTQYLHYLEARNYTLPHHGLGDDEYEEMICLDWTGLAQLHLRKLYSSGSVQCYSVWWLALKDDFSLRDCLMADASHGVWWGGGEMAAGGFPVTRANVPPEKMVTGRLDRDPWGQVIRRAWISDHASMLLLPARFNGLVSVNHELDEQVCMEVPGDPGATKDRTLSYTLCIAPNLTALASHMHQRAVRERRLVGLAMPTLVNYSTELEKEEHGDGETHEVTVLEENFRPEVVTRVEERLENPIWIPWMFPENPQLTQEAVLQYVDRMLSNRTLGVWGHVLLPASWQTRPGEMEFDPERFPDPLALSQELQTKGFRLALTIHPFVSVDAPAFNAGSTESLWVRQKNSVLPALVSYDEQHPSVMTDFSNPRARQWYAAQLRQLKDKYQIDRFHLQPADAHTLPAFHEHHLPVPGSDATLMFFMASVSSVSPPISTEGTVTPPLPPTFVSLGTGDGSWEGLETLVPRVLTLAMLGFPFVDVGPIGGLARAGHVPDRELYIRWIEAAAFLPAMQISVLPSTYGEEVEELAQEYLAKRKELVLPRLLARVRDGLDHGRPLITPLSIFVPDDPEAAKVDDEWMIGDDLLVAPVTHRGERKRTFYLPKGIWRDEIDGHLRSGGRWVKNYKVPLTKIPHFTLKYINDFET